MSGKLETRHEIKDSDKEGQVCVTAAVCVMTWHQSGIVPLSPGKSGSCCWPWEHGMEDVAITTPVK